MALVPRIANVKAFACSLTVLAAVFLMGCSRDPQHMLAHGTKFVASGKYSEAIIELKNAVNAAPGLAEARKAPRPLRRSPGARLRCGA